MQHDSRVMFEDLFSKSGLSLERLRSFAEIVEAGGIAAASRNNANRQSQLSHQLKELEIYFGVELIRRGRGRGKMQLTAAGEQLDGVIRQAFGSLRDFCRQCREETVELSIGAGESLIQWLLLPRFSRIINAHPELTASFVNLRNDDILAQVRNGTLEFGVVTRPVLDRHLGEAKLGALQFALFVPRELLSGNRRSHTDELIGHLPLAVQHGSANTWQVLEDTASQHDLKLNVSVRLSSYPQLATAVQDLRLAAIMPLQAANTLPKKSVRSIRLPFLQNLDRTVSLVWNSKTAEVRPAIANYGKVFSSHFRTGN